MGKVIKIDAYGRTLTTMELAMMVHLSQKTVRDQLKALGYPDWKDVGERFMKEHGIEDAEALERRRDRIRNEHPDYYKPVEHPPVIRFAPAQKNEPKPKRMTYTQELIALGFEPWPSDYELEARGER